VGALEESRAHLRKAREFLDAASLEVELELYSAAASSAVLAGINAKDATKAADWDTRMVDSAADLSGT